MAKKKKKTNWLLIIVLFVLAVILGVGGYFGYQYREDISKYYMCATMDTRREQYQCFSEMEYQFTQDKADAMFKEEVMELYQQGLYQDVIDLIAADCRYVANAKRAQVGLSYEFTDDELREAFTESHYQLAMEGMENGDPYRCIVHLSRIEQYRDVNEEMKAAKYEYCVTHLTRDDEKTRNYLTELKDADYENAAKLYDKYIDLHVKVLLNKSSSDTTHNYKKFARKDKIVAHVWIKGKKMTKKDRVSIIFVPVLGESTWLNGNPYGISASSYMIGYASGMEFGGELKGKVKVQVRWNNEDIYETIITLK